MASQMQGEELQAIDAAADREEIQRLLDKGRKRPVKLADATGWKQLSTTQVRDWRYRNGWIWRSRLVAREYQIYAPSSVASTTKILPALLMSSGHEFGMFSADVKDAYLMVPQQEKVFILPPPSWKDQHPEDEAWELLYCLPGQRIGAKAWHDYFSEVLRQEGVRAFAGTPSLFKSDKGVCLLTHVDDFQLFGKNWRDSKSSEETGGSWIYCGHVMVVMEG